MKIHHSHPPILTISILVTDIRWYYGPIAFVFALLQGGSAEGTISSSFGVLVLYLMANFVMHVYLVDVLNRRRGMKFVPLANLIQVFLDIIFFSMMIHTSGNGLPGAGQLFYLVPIITSTIFFGFLGALCIAFLSGAITFLFLLTFGGWTPLGAGGLTLSSAQLIIPFTEATIITSMYVVASFFGGYITRSIRIRDEILREKIHREEEHIRKLNVLAKEFDASAKLLVRRDLDLTKANRELERIDQMKSEIISVVAHQLRTPLSAVKWTLKMITDGDAGELAAEQKTFLMKAYESNERMIGLVNDMLSADRLESGKFRYRFFPIQIEDLIENLITEMLPKANAHQVVIKFARPAESLPRITIDPDKIRDVIQNLLDNAIKYSRHGGVIHVATDHDGEWVHLIIKDQGIGIPAGEREKIFSRFYRAQNALRMETDGSGLGLFIVRGIIQRHGGEIWFESEEGKGTVMHVRLPFDKTESISIH